MPAPRSVFNDPRTPADRGGDAPVPRLTRDELRKAEDEQASVPTSCTRCCGAGVRKNSPVRRGHRAWSGLAAGLSMGCSMIADALLYQALPDAPWWPPVSTLGYSVGFLIVILGGQQHGRGVWAASCFRRCWGTWSAT